MITKLRTWLLASGVVIPLVLFACVSPLHASADELLQKAIYTEETVGNLNDAIKLYEQVISSAKDANHAAAQAQYRLGLCYKKQQNDDLAREAFQAVIDKYPAEKELVQLARKQLPEVSQLQPVPWQDGESLHLVMRLATGLEVGTMIYMVQSTQHDGKPAWECSTRGFISINGSNSYSRVLCDKETFVPLVGHWHHSLLGTADAKYAPDHVDIVVKGKQEPVKIDLTSPVWDNEQAFEVFRRLPLRVGYKTNMPIVSSLVTTLVPLKIEVPTKEIIEVPAGKFECYKVVLDIGQTFWISADEHRYVTRFEAGGVIADLTRISTRRTDQTEPCSFEGMTFQVPKGWNYHVSTSKQDGPSRKLLLFDPAGLAVAKIEVGPLSTLSESQRSSVKAWSESFVTSMSQKTPDFKPSDAGIGERRVSGETAAIVSGTFKEGSTEMALLGVGWFHSERAMHLKVTGPAEYLKTLQPSIDELLDSIKLD